MATVLSMLFLILFIKCKRHIWFLGLYAFFLLVFTEGRHLIDNYFYLDYPVSGKYFFKYYSDVQFIMIIASAVLLTGWSRIISILSFLLFSIYNLCIYLYWGEVGIEHYDIISFAVIMINISLVTYSQTFIKNVCMLLFVSIATIGQEANL